MLAERNVLKSIYLINKENAAKCIYTVYVKNTIKGRYK